ncbi:glycosyltransferase family 4 protein [Pacificispira sp.]|uniref:glycosyltransferase family 4 protein n=1 Tax=Pacificispira sp. TaxID=2888761 RepID=UPI003BABF854
MHPHPEHTSLLIVTDAWRPQINGVVRSLEATIHELEKMGVRVEILAPHEFTTIPCPTYPDIRLSLTRRKTVRRRILDHQCEHLHIATEGPLGLLAASAARSIGMPFTTGYHSRFPEYAVARFPLPIQWFYAWFRRFHNSGDGCMVATETLKQDLAAKGFRNLMIWSRGVDTDLFRPMEGSVLPPDLPRPIFMNVGRLAVEKNLGAFLDLDLPGTKVVVGEGPLLAGLKRDYPDVIFTGPKTGEDLVRHFCSADAFVFPSLTDTFGLVVLEALACGVPVAAFPVMGPRDVIGDGGAGALSDDLRQAALEALDIPAERCRAWAMRYSWAACARQFIDNANVAQSTYQTRSADRTRPANAQG